MKTTLLALFILIATIIIVLFVLGGKSKSGLAPGLISGKLSPCSVKPNCVCSEYKTDTSHYIEPIKLSSETRVDAYTILKNLIQTMGGHIQMESSDYLAASFSSAVFGFVDDFELRIDAQKNIIHIRSASRIGKSDMGVNNKRVKLLKELYDKKLINTIG